MSFLVFDEKEIPVMVDGNPGDASARTGEIATAFAVRKRLGISRTYDLGRDWWLRASRTLLVDKTPARYWKNWGQDLMNVPTNKQWGTSRDQLLPMVIAAGFWNDIEYLDIVRDDLRSRGWRTPNGDIWGPQEATTLRRSYNLCGVEIKGANNLGDFVTYTNSWIRRVKGKYYDDVGDDVLHVQLMLIQRFSFQTFWSKKALEVYKKRPAFKPINYRIVNGEERFDEMRLTTEISGAEWALFWYHRPFVKSAPINLLFDEIVGMFK